MKKSRKAKLIVFVLMVLFLAVGLLLIFMSKNNYIEKEVLYYEDNSINYKVYLKENSFFESKYLDMDQTYIASLIDYIDITYNYNASFSDVINDEYYYTIDAIISADKTNGIDGNYWSKSYRLYSSEATTITNASNLNFSNNIKIDYNQYNEILTSFKREFSVNIDGNLEVVLNVHHKTSSDNLNKEAEKESTMSLTIPLTSLTIDVSVTKDKLDDTGSLMYDKIYKTDMIYTIYKIAGCVFLSIATVLLFFIILLIVIEAVRKSEYDKVLEKILKVYDGIIVNIRTLPKLDELEVINVNEFSELLDAHSEIRKPINYKLDDDMATFLLINEGIAWKYILKKDECDK